MSAIDSRPLLGGAGSDPYPAFSQRRRRGVRVTTAAAVALGLALSGGAVAGAATSAPSARTAAPSGTTPNGGTPPVAMGTVKSVGSDTFTLTTRDNTTVTVDVSSTTTYLDQSVTSPTFANVTVGQQVAVFGTDSSTTVTATKVAIGKPNGGPDGKGGPGGPGSSVGKGGPGGMPSSSPSSSSNSNSS